VKLFISVVFTIILLPSLAYAETEASTSVEALPPNLRTLLTKEMRLLQEGMQSIIPAYVAGNWNEIEQTAGKMANSYIMKQSLTGEQKRELQTLLPRSFILLDQQFHYLSGMLKHAAENKKTELVGFYYSKLVETCVSCHTQHATHRFPALGSNRTSAEHSH